KSAKCHWGKAIRSLLMSHRGSGHNSVRAQWVRILTPLSHSARPGGRPAEPPLSRCSASTLATGLEGYPRIISQAPWAGMAKKCEAFTKILHNLYAAFTVPLQLASPSVSYSTAARRTPPGQPARDGRHRLPCKFDFHGSWCSQGA